MIVLLVLNNYIRDTPVNQEFYDNIISTDRL